MAIQIFNWCTSKQASCIEFPASAIVLVPSALVDSGLTAGAFGLVQGTITQSRPSTSADSCGPCGYVYTIEYDDDQLLDGYELEDKYINAVVCSSCESA